MANYSNLKTAIENAVDWNNGDNEITGQNLLDILETIIDSLGAKYKFVDVATPSSSITTPDEPLFYLAGEGTYTNFSGLSVTIPRGTLAIFYYDTAWHYTTVRTDSDAFFNVNQYLGTPSTTYTKANGRNAVPSALRSKGMIITYLTTNGWIIEQNLSTSGTWNADANWQTIGPVSVSQNTETGHTEIHIGSNDYPVISVTEIDKRIFFFKVSYDTNVSTTLAQVPLARRTKGALVTFTDGEKYYLKQFTGTSVVDSAWKNLNNWIDIISTSNDNMCFDYAETEAIPNTRLIIKGVKASVDVTDLSSVAIRDGHWFIRTLELSGNTITNMVLGNIDTNNTYHPYTIISNSSPSTNVSLFYINNKKNAIIYYKGSSNVKALFTLDLTIVNGINYNQYVNPVNRTLTTIRLANNVLNDVLHLFNTTSILSTLQSNVNTLNEESIENEYRFYGYEDKVHSDNLIDTSKLIFGKGIQGTTGQEVESENECCTPYIRVKSGTYYSYGVSPIVVYSKKKERQTSYYSNTQESITFTVASDSYIRCSGNYTIGNGNPGRMYVSSVQKNGPFFEKNDISNDNHIDIQYNLNDDFEKFTKEKGVVVSGTFGQPNTIYRVPLRFDGKETIDFDFVLNRDINVALTQIDQETMLDINDEGARASQLSQNSPIIKATWWYKNPNVGYCYPDYTSILQTSLGAQGNHPRPLGDYMRNSFNGEDAFSIRKISVTSDEIGITAENNGESFIIADSNGTTLYSFSYSTYSTINSLVAAINATNEYEAILYNYQGKDCSDLAILKIKITELFQPKNYEGANLGTAAPDSFETFFPLSSIGCRHHYRLTIEENASNTIVYSYLDGYPIGFLSIGRSNGLPFLYIGGSANGNSVFSGKIENLRIRNKIVEPSHGLAIMSHDMHDTSIETPYSENGGTRSIRAFDKMLTEIQERGYTFIDSVTFLGIQNGNLKDGEYPHKYAVIFIDDFHPEAYSVPLFRAVFNKHNCKPILPVIFKDLETATESELQAFKMAKSAGWSIWMHSYSHSVSAQSVGGMNWTTFIDMVDKYYEYPKTYLGFDVDAIIYPGNYSDNRTRRSLKNRGFIAGGSGWNDQRCYAGIDQMQFARISNNSFNNIDTIDTIISCIKQS